MTTFKSINGERDPGAPTLSPWSTATTFVNSDIMSCVPSRAAYNVTITYHNGLQKIVRSEKYLESIQDSMVPSNASYLPLTPACSPLYSACVESNKTEMCQAANDCDYYGPAVWSEPVRRTYTALNDFALIDSLISPLSGSYTMLPDQTYETGVGARIVCGKCLCLTLLEACAGHLVDQEQGQRMGRLSQTHGSTYKETTIQER